jgi:hypothetical protein
MTSPDKLRFQQKQDFNNRTYVQPTERSKAQLNDIEQRQRSGDITTQTALSAKKSIK